MNALQDTTKGKYKKMYQETTHKNLQNLNRVFPSLHSGTCLKSQNCISTKIIGLRALGGGFLLFTYKRNTNINYINIVAVPTAIYITLIFNYICGECSNRNWLYKNTACFSHFCL